jgi:hypothetical protein
MLIFRFHELLWILPDLRSVSSERKPQSNKIRLGAHELYRSRGLGTHKEKDGSAGVHESFDLILVEWITSRIRMNVIAIITVPRFLSLIFGTIDPFFMSWPIWRGIRTTFTMQFKLSN